VGLVEAFLLRTPAPAQRGRQATTVPYRSSNLEHSIHGYTGHHDAKCDPLHRLLESLNAELRQYTIIQVSADFCTVCVQDEVGTFFAYKVKRN
jgi:hypothetical protein